MLWSHALLQGIFWTQGSKPSVSPVFPERKRRLDTLEATQGAPRDPRRDSRGERSPWLPPRRGLTSRADLRSGREHRTPLESPETLAVHSGNPASQALGKADLEDLFSGVVSTELRPARRQSLQLCLTLRDPIDCSLPGSSVHGFFQARILEWVAIPFSRGSSQPRDRT